MELLEVFAKLANKKHQQAFKKPAFIRAMQWLGFVGLLRHDKIIPRKVDVKLKDLLFAAGIEPRVGELLPVILIKFKEYVDLKKIKSLQNYKQYLLHMILNVLYQPLEKFQLEFMSNGLMLR